jgi:hypothetical protein
MCFVICFRLAQTPQLPNTDSTEEPVDDTLTLTTRLKEAAYGEAPLYAMRKWWVLGGSYARFVYYPERARREYGRA